MQKIVHEVLLNRLVKLAHEKSLGRWTDGSDMTIAVDWDVKKQTKTTWKSLFCYSQSVQWQQCHKMSISFVKVYSNPWVVRLKLDI